jgi:hypothetical protein
VFSIDGIYIQNGEFIILADMAKITQEDGTQKTRSGPQEIAWTKIKDLRGALGALRRYQTEPTILSEPGTIINNSPPFFSNVGSSKLYKDQSLCGYSDIEPSQPHMGGSCTTLGKRPNGELSSLLHSYDG